MASPRLKGMKGVKFLTWFVSEKTSESVIRDISKHSDVDNLMVRGNGLNNVDPNLLASCINKMRKVLLSKTRMSREQVDVIFTDMNKGTNLIELDIRENDLSKVDQHILASCVNRMKKATLRKTCLSMAQKETMLKEIEKKTNLDMVDIRQNGGLGYLRFRVKNRGLEEKFIFE